jgi:hypothetical protein
MELKSAFISQYKASLKMIQEAVSKADDVIWLNKEYKNPFWQIAYHALFYTDLYLSESESKFTPWEKHKDEYSSMSQTENKTTIIEPYRQTELIEYLDKILGSLDKRIELTDFSATSGFYWLSFTKLELHIYNIRHIQHHAGQLIDRLREQAGLGTDWIGKS